MGEGFGAHTAASHGSRPIGLPTKLLRSKRSAEEAAEPSANSMNPHRTSGVPLILPRGEVSCVRGGGGHLTCARALRSCAGGARPGGLSAAYCVRRMFPWNSKKERSSSGVASRWMLATLTLVLSDSMAERGRMALPAKCAVGWFAITLPQPSASPIRWLFCSFGDSAPSTCCAKNKAVSLVTARRWRRTRPTTQQRRASQPDARCITREPSPRHPITAWASRTERTQVRTRRHSARFWRQI